MHIGILTLSISLPGCRSLKEKRQRMGGLHERFGRHPAVAVCESGELDRLEASEWTFVAVATSGPKVEALLRRDRGQGPARRGWARAGSDP